MRKICSITMLALCVLLAGCLNPQAELEKAAKQLSADLPKRLDPNTTWLEARAGDMEVIYVYEVNGITDADLKTGREKIKNMISGQLAANKSQLAAYIRNKIPMTYIYQNTSGKEVMRFTINPCEL